MFRRSLMAAAFLAAALPGASAQAADSQPGLNPSAPGGARLEQVAAHIAHELASLCPPAAKDDVDAHAKCTAGLRGASFIPFAPAGILFGADQADLRLAKKQLTHFQSGVWQLMYLSLFTFTGQWSVETDPVDHVGVIRVEAYFRNALPSGSFPYPFWHSAAKWNDYEIANELRFYLDPKDQVFVVTRSTHGSEANRGAFAHVTPPAFDGKWQWTDADGRTEPRASLFSNRYSAGNPRLAALDAAYRSFATDARKGSCMDCHEPSNKAGMSHLVLLQTPMHAAGEIDRVLREVRKGEMPQDELGLPKEIDPDLRKAILRSGIAFRKALRDADQWEAARRPRG